MPRRTGANLPAYVRDRRFDVPAANTAARALAPMHEPGHDLVRGTFLAPGIRRLFPDWPEAAAQTAAALPAEGDPRDPEIARRVDELTADADFRRLWARYDARPSRDEPKRFAHPVVGEPAVRCRPPATAGAGRQVVVVYRAGPGQPVRRRPRTAVLTVGHLHR